MTAKKVDAIVVGGGHNGLVSAALLAREGLDVVVLEARGVVGGAVRTETPFVKAPNSRASTGAYLLGLMPPELIETLGVTIPVRRRDPHYFLPTTDGRYLLFGSDQESTRRQFIDFFSEADWKAHKALNAELDQLRDDLGATWLQEPLSIEDTAARFVRPALQQAFVDLCRAPICDYLERFGFKSDLLKAMYATTDAFSGLYGTWDTPGTGMNFLIHNMCRLPGSDGTWMIVEGGMGTVSRTIAELAQREGAEIRTNAPVAQILTRGDQVIGVALESGEELLADTVVVGADPFQMQSMVGRDTLPDAYNARLDAMVKPGSTLKVNMCLSGLPQFTCLPEDRGQYGPTIHLLPDESVVIQSLLDGFEQVQAGKLPDFPTIEWYIHTTVDPTLKDAEGHHNAALFVQWVPYEIEGSSWEAEEDRYVEHLLSICDRFAPGTSDLVVDTFTLHPQKIESYFGITHGHIHHVDNAFGFADRVPYRTPIAGLYSASAGCHPAGSVIGAAGHNAARAVLKDRG